MVDPSVKDSALRPVRDDRVAVVGDGEDDRPRAGNPELALERLSRALMDEETWGGVGKNQTQLGPHPLWNTDGCSHLSPGRCDRPTLSHPGRAGAAREE
jgi:hypothetical protein